MGSLLLELSKQESLLKMMEDQGFTLIQQNGQRTYGGPPPNWGDRPAPSRDSEVFIGRLPRACFEDELIPLFLSAGELYEFRLMLDFSGTNRGYGYAHYATIQGAHKAIQTLNKFEIRENHRIGVLKSENNCRLVFGDIDPSCTKQQFEDFIHSATENILEVKLFKNFWDLKRWSHELRIGMDNSCQSKVPRGDVNKQFAMVEYQNHKAAALARRVLIPQYGHILAIDWAMPSKERKKKMSEIINFVDNGMELATARPIQGVRNDQKLIKSSAKPRLVPDLKAKPSLVDRFMPRQFDHVTEYFKYLLKTALFGSSNRLEIPLSICTEIQSKIVDRITNLEHCSQAVQLIFNYLLWYHEKNPSVIKEEMTSTLIEVQKLSDTFVNFLMAKLQPNYIPDPYLEEYYMKILPQQLSEIYELAKSSQGEKKTRLSGQITRALNCYLEMERSGELWCQKLVRKLNHLSVNQGEMKPPTRAPEGSRQDFPLERRFRPIVGSQSSTVHRQDRDRIPPPFTQDFRHRVQMPSPESGIVFERSAGGFVPVAIPCWNRQESGTDDSVKCHSPDSGIASPHSGSSGRRSPVFSLLYDVNFN